LPALSIFKGYGIPQKFYRMACLIPYYLHLVSKFI